MTFMWSGNALGTCTLKSSTSFRPKHWQVSTLFNPAGPLSQFLQVSSWRGQARPDRVQVLSNLKAGGTKKGKRPPRKRLLKRETLFAWGTTVKPWSKLWFQGGTPSRKEEEKRTAVHWLVRLKERFSWTQGEFSPCFSGTTITERLSLIASGGAQAWQCRLSRMLVLHERPKGLAGVCSY